MNRAAFLEELFGLSDRVALVTGGTKGLGRTMAETLARAGAKVSLCSRHGSEAESVARDIGGSTGAETLGVEADVSKKGDIDRLVKRVERVLGKIDILVANAGVNIRKGTNELTERDWESVVDLNLKGPFLLAQTLLPGMRERKWGRLVFLGSILSFVSIAGRAPYASSKAGILGLTRTLALESAPDGVCVNAICPGPFKTPMNVPLLENEQKNKAFLKKLPIGRWGEPEELAGLVLYLASPACSFMTGAAILIDGGWTAS